MKKNRIFAATLAMPLFSLVATAILILQNQLSSSQNPETKAQSSNPTKPIEVLSQQEGQTSFKVEVPDFKTVEMVESGQAYKTIDLSGAVLDERDVGKPALPVVGITINVPLQANCRYDVANPAFEDLENYNIYPAQLPQPDNQVAGQENLPKKFSKDEVFYNKDEFYPREIINIEEEKIFRGLPLRSLYFYPFQYNPNRKILRHYLSFEVVVTCPPTGVKPKIPPSSRDYFEAFKGRVIKNNSSQVRGEKSVLGQTSNGADLLIIAPPDFASAANTLAQWRRQKGIYTAVKTTTETGTTAEAITTYIKNAYLTWNPAPSFILLLGDAEFIPPHYKTPHPYEGNRLIATDLYYAAVDGTDYVPDLAIGRISIDTLAQAQDRINKIINYEKTPPTESSFYTNQGMAAYFQDGEGGVYDGYDDRPFVKTSEQIRDFFRTQSYNPNRIYYTLSNINPTNYNNGAFGSGEPLPSELLRANGFLWNGDRTQTSALTNGGIFWLNHRDHGSILGWGYPNYNTGDVNVLVNGNKLPLVSSFNCMSGWFDTETDDPNYGTDPNMVCFAESWQRNSNGGAMGIVASTRTSFSGYNDTLNKGLVDAVWPQFLTYSNSPGAIYLLGPALNYAKAYYCSLYPDSTVRKIEMEEFHFFGDPTSEIWTGVPQAMTVSAPSQISAGATSITVSVNQNSALVTAIQGETILGTAYSQNGSATVSLNPTAAEGQLTITVTKHNFRPYESTVNVTRPTAITFAGCWPYRYKDGRTVVYWETASEIDNIGFNVYYNATNNVSGATQINSELIPAATPGSMTGNVYTFSDPNRPTLGFWWIEALDLDGSTEKFGPYEIKSAPLAPTNLTIGIKTIQRVLITWKGTSSKIYQIEIDNYVGGQWRSFRRETLTGNRYDRRPGFPAGRYKVRVREKYGEWSGYKWFRI